MTFLKNMKKIFGKVFGYGSQGSESTDDDYDPTSGKRNDLRWNQKYLRGTRKVLTCGNDKTIRVWNIGIHGLDPKDNKVECSKVLYHENAVRWLEIIKRNYQFRNALVTCSSDYHVKIWNIFDKSTNEKRLGGLNINQETRKKWDSLRRTKGVVNEEHLLFQWKAHDRGINCCREITGDLLLTASFDCLIKVWNLRDLSLVHTIDEHKGAVYFIVELPGGEMFASSSADHTVRIWQNSKDFSCVRVLQAHTDWVTMLKLINNGRDLISASYDSTVCIWDWTTGKLQRKITVFDEDKKTFKLKIWRGFEIFNNYEIFVGSWEMQKIINQNLFDREFYQVLNPGEDAGKNNGNSIYAMKKINEDFLLVGRKNGSISVFYLNRRSPKQRKSVLELTGHTMYIHHMIVVDEEKDEEKELFFRLLYSLQNKNERLTNCMVFCYME